MGLGVEPLMKNGRWLLTLSAGNRPYWVHAASGVLRKGMCQHIWVGRTVLTPS